MSLRGFKLNLEGNGSNGGDQPPAPSSHPSITSYFNESNIHQDIKITFTLPSGELFEEVVKNGETVQEIKRRLCSASKIPSNSEFLLNGITAMLDPLSLNDIPGVVGNSSLQVVVKVKGQTTPAVTRREPTSGSDVRHNDTTSTTQIPPTSTPSTSTPTTYKYEPTDKQIEQQDKPTNTPTDPPAYKPTENAETTSEQMYTTGNGKDEKSNNTSHGTDELDTFKKGIDPPNFVEPASSTSPPESPSTLPSLPHAAFDSETTIPKSGLEKLKSGNESATTIDVKDDESSHKQIQTLGSGKRWFCLVV